MTDSHNLPSRPDDPAEVLGNPKQIRSDCRMISRLLSLGCIPEEKIIEILQLAPGLAHKAAARSDAREYAAIMRVLIQAAKLGLETQPKQVEHVHAILSPEQRATLIEAQLIAEAEARGLLVDAKPGDDGAGT